MGEGLGPLFCVSPAHMSHLLSAAACGNDTTNRERELACSLPSPPLPFVSVGSPTVMWGSYRLFIAVGFFFLVHMELQSYFCQLQGNEAKPA